MIIELNPIRKEALTFFYRRNRLFGVISACAGVAVALGAATPAIQNFGYC